MNILLLGSGGREHSLAKTLVRSKSCDKLYTWPGSDAISKSSHIISADSLISAIKKAYEKAVTLCIVGEEKWLVEGDGVFEICKKYNIICWGPSKNAAKLEVSKISAKEFMNRNGIPTAEYKVANNYEEAKKLCGNNFFFEKHNVIKFDGLAGGKGVRVCKSNLEAVDFIEDIYKNKIFNSSDKKLVIENEEYENEEYENDKVIFEECLFGRELSIFCAVAGNNYQVLIPSCDYKRLGNNDEGPNTGGMGAVSSYELITPDMLNEIEKKIIKRTINALKNENIHYKGFLYFGLILTKNGPYVLEYNCRLGDPEAQSFLPMIDGDFALWIEHLANFSSAKGEDFRKIKQMISFKSGWGMSLVLTSKDYPYKKNTDTNYGEKILGLENVYDSDVVHSGTRLNQEGEWETAGGRVLSLCFYGEDLNEVRKSIYKDAENIKFNGCNFRNDIGVNFV